MSISYLNFYAYNLEKPCDILLTFKPPPIDKLYADAYPVVWKVLRFDARVHCKASVVHSTRYAWGSSQITRGNIVDSATWEEPGHAAIMATCTHGVKVVLDKVKIGVKGSKSLLTIKNQTGDRANVSLGVVIGDGIFQTFDPLMVWTNVGDKANVSVELAPIVTAYATREYQATQLLRGEIDTDPIWTANLTQLKEVTSWHVEEDGLGSYTINPAVMGSL